MRFPPHVGATLAVARNAVGPVKRAGASPAPTRSLAALN